ncbi:hypothetical protein [Cellulomonas bogoriensis]|uniref:Polyketide cyclase n=1 Tax=Cellulomonas bogoriensis 69B4 = DSM 16987 TaxID=1386082 RepID=A0A0A0BX61_9CELL|nr:hypothetical protein [Cellulomonas bogoriensis]KGM13003.1 hypothetical protein N869_16845 [Cellulomonas bogoriensis 69B4 = DSM 16987]
MTQPPVRPRPAARRGTELPISAERAWALVTDVRNHPRRVPWTRVDAAGALQVGDTLNTAVGPRSWGGGLVDRMQAERLDPPQPDLADTEGAPDAAGVMVLRRLGPVLDGARTVHVHPTGPTTCRVTWVEHAHLRTGPRALTAPLLWPVTAYVARRARRRLSAEMRITRR